MSKYLTSFNASNIPDNQPVIIRGTVALCRIANYWPADPSKDRMYPQQSLYIENPQILPWVLESNPNSPDYNDAVMQANCMVTVITMDKVTMNSQGHQVYKWNNTVYQNADGSTPPQINLFHRTPDGGLKQLQWEHDLAQGVNVEIMVTPKIRGKDNKRKIAQIGNHIIINQPEIEWYTPVSNQFTATALGLDPSMIQSTSIPVLYPNATQPYDQQANTAYNQPQANATQPYNQPQPNNAYGQPNVAQPYGQPQQNATQPYGQPQQNATQPYGQPNTTQPYGQTNATQPYGQQANNAYNQPQTNAAQPYGQQANTAYNQPQTNAAQPYGQTNVAQPYNQPQQNAYGQTQPSENFMNVPDSGLPFN